MAAGVFGYTSAKDGKYSEAMFLAQGGQELEAAQLLEELGEYKDAHDQLAALKEADGSIAIPMAKAGDTVTFGSYEQDGDTSNGSEPIEWMVLRTDGQEVLLLSVNILDAQPYLEIETEDGVQDLDQWLDTAFAETAFAGCSTETIKDVGLLSREEMDEYYSQAKDAQFTEYAMSQKPKRGYAAGHMWWLEGMFKFNIIMKSDGSASEKAALIAIVAVVGVIGGAIVGALIMTSPVLALIAIAFVVAVVAGIFQGLFGDRLKNRKDAKASIEFSEVRADSAGDLLKSLADVKKGDTLRFGRYTWEVLSVENGQALLITQNVVMKRNITMTARPGGRSGQNAP